MSEQYSYPAAPTNPVPYAAAPRQQQRTGPIIVGATTATSTRGATATSTTGTGASASTASSSIKVPPPVGLGANGSLSILGSHASSLEKNRKKRRAECINDLDRLVPPLILCAKRSANGHNDDGQDDEAFETGKVSNKKRRGDNTESGESNVASGGDNDDQSDNKNDMITSSKIGYHKQLQKELAQYKQHNQLLMKRRNNVLKSMVALHELYETGLDGIARMNDLRFVPDNVMPNKVPK